MIYKLSQRLYKKLMSNSESHFDSLVRMGDKFPRRDQKVIYKINQTHGLKKEISGVKICKN